MIDQSGRPIAGVEILPTRFTRSSGVSASVALSREVARRHASKTDPEWCVHASPHPEGRGDRGHGRVLSPLLLHQSVGIRPYPWRSPWTTGSAVSRGRIEPNPAVPGPEGRMRVVIGLEPGGFIPGHAVRGESLQGDSAWESGWDHSDSMTCRPASTFDPGGHAVRWALRFPGSLRRQGRPGIGGRWPRGQGQPLSRDRGPGPRRGERPGPRRSGAGRSPWLRIPT